MQILSIGNTDYDFPETWNEVKLHQYQKLEKSNLSGLTMLNQYKTILNCIGDIPNNLIRGIKPNSLIQLVDLVEPFRNDFAEPMFNNIIEIKGSKYGVIQEMDELTFGEFVDIEHFINLNQAGLIQNLHKILAVLYRPINQLRKDSYSISNYISESNKDFENRAELFRTEFPVRFASGGLIFLLGFRTQVFADYSSMFSASNSKPGFGKGEQESANFSRKWNWYSAKMILANDNILNLEDVNGLGLFKCLNYLSYLRDKQTVQKQTMK